MRRPHAQHAVEKATSREVKSVNGEGSEPDNWLSREIRRQVLAAVLPEFAQQARPVRQNRRVDNLCSIGTRDRHYATFRSGVDLDDIFPANSLVFPKPGDLLESVPLHDDRTWEQRCKHYRTDSETHRNHHIERASPCVHRQADGDIDQVDHQNGPRNKCTLVWGECNTSVRRYHGLSLLVSPTPN